MAINKELYERYKQLKAQGVSITLAELKSQMEAETFEKTFSSEQSTCVQTPVLQNNFTQSSSQCVPQNSSQTLVQTAIQPTSQTVIQPTIQPTIQPQVLQESSFSNYTGNISTSDLQKIDNTSYLNQFTPSTVFTPKVTNTNQIAPQQPYQGNIKQTFEQEISRQQKYGLLGYPLGHSLSEYIHKAGFQSLNSDATYELLETPPESLVDRIKYLKSNNYAGFNVTIPLKLPVTMFLDEVDISADVIGAVNTVVINPDKTMKGYNTDVIGFKNAIPSDVVLVGKTVGILGTGGAARAAISALATSQVKAINLYTRNIPNSIELLKFLRVKFPNVVFNSFQIEAIRDLSKIDILVNCTPIGMQGRAADMSPVEEEQLRTLPQGAIVYDVIYNPKKTLLLKLAQKNGYRIINGMDMLVYQALEAERIWTGQTPDFKDMKIAALENI